MPYHGYIEIEVRLMRQGHGEDSSGVAGSGYGVEAERKLRIEERDAREWPALFSGVKGVRSIPKGVAEVVAAVRDVLNEDREAELRGRLATVLNGKVNVESLETVVEMLERRS